MIAIDQPYRKSKSERSNQKAAAAEESHQDEPEKRLKRIGPAALDDDEEEKIDGQEEQESTNSTRISEGEVDALIDGLQSTRFFIQNILDGDEAESLPDEKR